MTVCHLPPGTSKWNKIEHRLFSFITQNWRGKPLVTHQVIVNLIAATTTKGGLSVRSRLDERIYPKGRRVSDAQLARVNLEPHRVPRRMELHHSPNGHRTMRRSANFAASPNTRLLASAGRQTHGRSPPGNRGGSHEHVR